MTNEHTQVVILGAGVAGLTVASFLRSKGVDCIVLEKSSREHVMERQRAGVIDARAVRTYRRWGLEERIVGASGPAVTPSLTFRLDGQTRVLPLEADDHADGRFVPQQVLVRNLIDAFLEGGGDLRFDADVSLEGLPDAPIVRTRAHTIHCELVAGCDGDHGVSRASIPREHLTRFAQDYGYAWLTVLAEVAPSHNAMMAIHARGFAGQFARGRTASRFYLQCALDAAVDEWHDERIYAELEARFVEPISRGRIVSKQVVPIRSVVYAPMRFGSLFLLGDAAHIIPPMSAKGMNLAIHDAEVFADAALRFFREHDRSLLDAYSETCLRHVWTYQAFAAWWTEMIHDAGDASLHGAFRHAIARSSFEQLFTSSAARRQLSELIAGLA